QHRPGGQGPDFRFKILCENCLRQDLGQQHPVSADTVTRLAKPAVRRAEIRPRDAIAVEKDQVAARTRRDGAIADFGETKAAVLMPDMPERHADPGDPTVDDLPRLRPRSVVGHDDLEIAVVLPSE